MTLSLICLSVCLSIALRVSEEKRKMEKKKQDEQTTKIVLKYNRYTFMFICTYVKREERERAKEKEKEILSTTVKSGTKQNKTKNK